MFDGQRPPQSWLRKDQQTSLTCQVIIRKTRHCLLSLAINRQTRRWKQSRAFVLRDTDTKFLHNPVYSHLISTPTTFEYPLQMPRLHPRMLHHARKIDSLLPLVLQATRDLNSAKNELRWLKEYITSQPSNHPSPKSYEHRLRQVCIDRARGKPLQYILGSEYFGDLEIACVKGVLIPR